MDVAVISNNVVEVQAPDHSERSHHPFGPSKLTYLDSCPGFESTDGTSEAAEQGTRLHEIMDALIQKYKVTKTPLLTLLDAWAQTNALDDDERSLLVFCIRALDKYLPKAIEIINERRVYIYNPDGTVLTHGSLDILMIFPGGTGLLDDFKFGWIPVPSAATNLQGKAYALGALMEKHSLQKIGVRFIQPKLGHISEGLFTRSQINDLYQSIKTVIDRVQMFRRDPQANVGLLSPSDYCCYCVHAQAGSCPAKLAQLRRLTPQPNDVAAMLDRIQTPEDAARARYAVEILEAGGFIEGVKSKAREIAINNGGEISYTDAEGQLIRYAIEDRRHDRALGETLEVFHALENVMSMEEVLSCAELSITKLEASATNAIYEQANKTRDEVLKNHESIAAALPKKEAKKQLDAIKEQFPKKTKKQATEDFQQILETQGLLSRPEGTIQVLRRKKNEPKQLKN